MDVTKPIALVDLSSFVFYRFFAIKRWLQISGNEGKLSQDEVLDKFEKLFESNLNDIKKKLKVDLRNVLLARDCPRDKIWRMAIYPEYKGTRDERRSPDFDPTVFTKTYADIIPRLTKKHGYNMVQYDAAEADDIIAIAHDYIRHKSPTTPIYILSADTDFMQLKGPNTHIINFAFKPIAQSLSEEKQQNYLLWKIIKGDDSDNIPAIDKKIGDVTALKLATNPDALRARIQSSQHVKDAFERNEILISFERIPMSMRDAVSQVLTPLFS